MLTTFSLNNESEAQEWDVFVKYHPKSTPFHLSCWIRTIQETYSFKPLLYVYKDRSGNISGLFPCFQVKNPILGSRVVSLPFSDYCGPIFIEENHGKEALSTILKKDKHKIKYIEIRNSVYQDLGFITQNYYKRHVLNLNYDYSKIKKIINKRTIQYSINKARKNKVLIKEENTLWGIEEFYRLNIKTRKKHGVPCQPKKFFTKLFDNMVTKGHAYILLAIYDSKVVAATIFFKFKEGIYYKYNATDPKHLSKITPNHLLIWYAIEKACNEGFKFIDFGRSSPNNKGLMRYKELWGGVKLDLPYNYYPKIKGMGTKTENTLFYHILANLWRSLPDYISKKIGPAIYKYMA